MKKHTFLVLIISTLSIVACTKVKKGALESIEGDYDWSHSIHELDNSSITTNEEVSDQYGARINSKNRLILFKNGVEVERFKIVEYTPNANGNTSYLRIKTTEYNNIVYSNGDTLRTQHFPFRTTGGKNYFLKKQ